MSATPGVETGPAKRSELTVAVIGGGLGGLYAAELLAQAGVAYQLFEAQARLGGRVLTEPLAGGAYDLGPTWFWPAHQARMRQLTAALGLASFAQPARGALIHELSATQRLRADGDDGSMDGSMRLAGGIGGLVQALAQRLDAQRLHSGQALRRLELLPTGGLMLELGAADGSSGSSSWQPFSHAILTLPPRLLAATVDFSPALPAELLANWAAVPTWMAGQAKLLAVYERPFWQDEQLSGAVRSRVGPLVEIHDASGPEGSRGPPALFGFVGVDPRSRRAHGEAAVQQAALAQLVRLFGPLAGQPKALFFKDWATDRWLATERDETAPRQHPSYGSHRALPAAWAQRLLLAGSETAAVHGGYLEGALEASEAAVQRLLDSL